MSSTFQGTHAEILEFADKFGARDKFSFFEKANVNGVTARPLYNFLEERLSDVNGLKDVEWNFGKFLVDHKGNPYKRFGPRKNPIPDMVVDIEYLLNLRKDDIQV